MPVARGLTFGSVAERYERYRPGYPAELVDLVLAGSPAAATAVEIGAGTGKATRLVAARGVSVTAVEPDPQMCAVLARTSAGLPVTIVSSTLEDLPGLPPVDLLYSAAAWHWTVPETRWSLAAGLLREGGVFASFGGPVDLADDALAGKVEALRSEVMDTDDTAVPGDGSDGTGLRWPGDELVASPLFTDVTEVGLPQVSRIPADDLVGLMSTVSSYLVLPLETRAELLARIRSRLPDAVDVRRDLRLHRAVRV